MATRDVAALWLEPLDGLFFRDGRPFEPGGYARSGLPDPRTLTGALRTWLLEQAGCGFDRLGAAMRAGRSFDEALADGQPAEARLVSDLSVRGPWIARQTRGISLAIEPLVTVPTTLIEEEGGALGRLDPLDPTERLPGWNVDVGLPLWRRSRSPAKRATGFLSLRGLGTFLAGGVPESTEVEPEANLFARDHRTGIGIDPKAGSTQEGLIYGVALLALRANIGFYAEVDGPARLLARFSEQPIPLPFGGERRHCAVRRAPRVVWPEPTLAAGDRTLVMATTPAFRDEGATPIAHSVGSAVTGPLAISGWDLARGGPRPTRFAAAPGSVFFFDRASDTPTRSLCNAADAQLGYGCFVRGKWNHA